MERLGYDVVDTALEYEERRYNATWWVTTTLTVTDQLLKHVTEGLERLKRYREGYNEKDEHVAEKAPILLKIECDVEETTQDNKFVVYQYLGDGTLSQPPSPNDPRVRIEMWSAFEAFVRTFQQLQEDDDFISEARNLRAFLAEFHVNAYYNDDCYYVASFDGTDNLWKQTNEIWFLKQND